MTMTAQMQRKSDLTKRISRLTELSAEMELYIQKLKDDPEENALEELEEEYQALYAETIEIYSK